MSTTLKTVAHITSEEYLALEEKSQTRHEYLDGVIYDWQGIAPSGMAGGGKAHNTITQNIAFALRRHLRGTNCGTFMGDVRVHVTSRNGYFYPDVLVSCSARDQRDPLTVFEPTLIIEVLSDSTEAFDRSVKQDCYKELSSLKEYVLVSSKERKVEIHLRTPAGSWDEVPVEGHTICRLESVGIGLTLDQIYDEITFDQ